MSVLKKVLIGAALAVLAVPASAHHSGAMFDRSKSVKLEGTVKTFQYTNPHSWLMVLVKGEDGKIVEWGFEAEGPSSLMRQGIKAKTFAPGERVTILGNPMKDGRPAGNLVSVTKPDGTIFYPRGAPAPGAPVGG